MLTASMVGAYSVWELKVTDTDSDEIDFVPVGWVFNATINYNHQVSWMGENEYHESGMQWSSVIPGVSRWGTNHSRTTLTTVYDWDSGHNYTQVSCIEAPVQAYRAIQYQPDWFDLVYEINTDAESLNWSWTYLRKDVGDSQYSVWLDILNLSVWQSGGQVHALGETFGRWVHVWHDLGWDGRYTIKIKRTIDLFITLKTANGESPNSNAGGFIDDIPYSNGSVGDYVCSNATLFNLTVTGSGRVYAEAYNVDVAPCRPSFFTGPLPYFDDKAFNELVQNKFDWNANLSLSQTTFGGDMTYNYVYGPFPSQGWVGTSYGMRFTTPSKDPIQGSDFADVLIVHDITNVSSDRAFFAGVVFNATPYVNSKLIFGPWDAPTSRFKIELAFRRGERLHVEIYNGTTKNEDYYVPFSWGEPIMHWISYDNDSTVESGITTPRATVVFTSFDVSEYRNDFTTLRASTYYWYNYTADWFYGGCRYDKNTIVDIPFLNTNLTIMPHRCGCFHHLGTEPGWDHGDMGNFSTYTGGGDTSVVWREWFRGWHGMWEIYDDDVTSWCLIHDQSPSDTSGTVEVVFTEISQAIFGESSQNSDFMISFRNESNKNIFIIRVKQGPSNYEIREYHSDDPWDFTKIADYERRTTIKIGITFNVNSNLSIYLNGAYVAQGTWWHPGHVGELGTIRYGTTSASYESVVLVQATSYVEGSQTLAYTIGGEGPDVGYPGGKDEDVPPRGEYGEFESIPEKDEISLHTYTQYDFDVEGAQVWYGSLYDWMVYIDTPREESISYALVWTSYNDTPTSYDLVEPFNENTSEEFRRLLGPRWGYQRAPNISVWCDIWLENIQMEYKGSYTYELELSTTYLVYGRIPLDDEFDLLETVVRLAAPYLLFAVFPFIIYEVTGRRELAPLGIILAGIVLGIAGQLTVGQTMLTCGLGALAFFVIQKAGGKKDSG